MEHAVNNQFAYRFTTFISNLGKVKVPEVMRNLYNKKVEIILMIPKEDKDTSDSISEFYEMINEYNSIDEQELDINTIFNDREKRETRKFIFD
ncbi:MAG: hypothetical protein K9H64_21815 [Bacteroidales bacterium]|nr:hypothetical protein [Bacteroidales bacterium]MCF8458666.1 hypothetical protein [Bacteroidales bacterium]